jgi:hypothetical protein
VFAILLQIQYFQTDYSRLILSSQMVSLMVTAASASCQSFKKTNTHAKHNTQSSTPQLSIGVTDLLTHVDIITSRVLTLQYMLARPVSTLLNHCRLEIGAGAKQTWYYQVRLLPTLSTLHEDQSHTRVTHRTTCARPNF